MRGDGRERRQRVLLVHPAAGEGVFYDLRGRRTGVEIVRTPSSSAPTSCNGSGRQSAVRVSMAALAFVNHAAAFADYIGLILDGVLNEPPPVAASPWSVHGADSLRR